MRYSRNITAILEQVVHQFFLTLGNFCCDKSGNVMMCVIFETKFRTGGKTEMPFPCQFKMALLFFW